MNEADVSTPQVRASVVEQLPVDRGNSSSSSKQNSVSPTVEPDQAVLNISDTAADVRSYLDGKEIYLYEATTINGIHMALGQRIRDAVEHAPSRLREHTTILTKCVRTRLPKHNVQDVIVSVDIGPAREFARTLFPASTFDSDPNLAEMGDRTLQRACTTALKILFPSNIQHAIEESQLRAWERGQQLLHVTNCVTMDIRCEEPYLGTIHLRLGFLLSLPIIKALHRC